MGIPLLAEVFPGRIVRFDKSDFLGASPAFQLLFSLDRAAYIAKAFEPDEAVAIVERGEALVRLFPVLEDTFEKVAGKADVEGSAFAGDDVGEVGALDMLESVISARTRGMWWRAQFYSERSA